MPSACLVILLVPVVMLQKLAITASWWILAITISEMLLNPIVYYYLKAPEPELVVMREHGGFRRGHRALRRRAPDAQRARS